MTTSIAPFEDIANWERALYAFLAEKERRSGSRRTVEGYSRMLQHFFGTLGKPPDQVTSQEVFTFAHGVGLSGKDPSPVTIGARMACVSSFYRFLIRMEIVSSNPCDQLERPRVSPSPPRGLSAEEIKRLLAVIPEKPSGLRDRAIVRVDGKTGVTHKGVHAFRRAAAAQMNRLGMNDSDILEVLGWQSIEMLRRYTAEVADELAQAAHRRFSPGDALRVR